jgi:hypothetical protein
MAFYRPTWPRGSPNRVSQSSAKPLAAQVLGLRPSIGTVRDQVPPLAAAVAATSPVCERRQHGERARRTVLFTAHLCLSGPAMPRAHGLGSQGFGYRTVSLTTFEISL